MDCPNCQQKLEKVLFHNVEAGYCPECLGIWFDDNELRLAKDDKDQQLNWLDFDIWRDSGKFEIFGSKRLCPKCHTGLCQIGYDDSKVKIDFCKMCQGIWLDRGEFKQIMNYLRRKADYEVLNKYAKNIVLELWEVFSGPETFKEEVADFLMLLKLFNYKFVVQHPFLSSLIENSQK